MSNILILSGPNLNLLGRREPQVYGTATLEEIHGRLERLAAELQLQVECRQSNAEHELIGYVHAAIDGNTEGIIINPGGLTHTSVTLRDALLGAAIPYIEVHLSNPMAREPFRRHSYLSDAAAGVIFGLGAQGYELALRAHHRRLAATRNG